MKHFKKETNMSTKSWMERKKIPLNNAKGEESQVTVMKFIEMYNQQNMILMRTTHYSQMLLGQLFIENKDNPFFKTCGETLLGYAEEKAKKIEDNPAEGQVELKPDPNQTELDLPETTESETF